MIPKRDEAGRVTTVYPGVSKAIRGFFPEIEEAEGEARAAGMRDALSVLYVALTRAKYALHLIVPPAAEEGKVEAKHSAQLIRSSLGLATDAVDDEGLLLERGDANWHERLQGEREPTVEEPPAEPADATGPLLRNAPSGPGRNLARRNPSSLEGGAQVDLASTLRLEPSRARQRGSIVHAWCESIDWIEEGLPDDDALRTAAQKTAVGATISTVLPPQTIRDHMSRPM